MAVRTPSTLWSTTAATGAIRIRITSATMARAASVIISGVTIDPPVRPITVANSSTMPAPPNWPTDQNAWKKLMIGRRRADSTWTPMAFMATSRAPLPRPIRTPPTMAIG